ncbi:MAG: response regulator [Ignavibacteriales bacterium]|nr:response regulator [Ignavibacteriales bacterium]
MIASTLINAKILIVDDQQANIDVLTGLLDAKGYTDYTTTTDSRKVINLFEEYKPNLLLLDLNMPHLTGFQVMMQLKVFIPANTYFPILVLTADITPESKQKALAAGASDFLTKPFDLIEVDLRIKNLLKVRYLHQQLENQNQVLEEKVKERTKELEKANIELIVAKEQAEGMNRLKNCFLSNMSHELRTPLISVLGFAELLQQELKDPEQLEFVKNIMEGGQRLNNTLSKILEISKLEAANSFLKLQPYNLADEIKVLVKSFLPMAQSKRLFLKTELNDTSLNVYIDSELFGKALYHLVSNGIKFTKEGGVLVTLNHERKQDHDWAVTKVIDTGIGISKENLNKIFDAFRQASEGNSRNYEGTGLGITIAKRIVELMQGYLQIESDIGKGSTFSIWLPAIPNKNQIHHQIEEKLASTIVKPPTIKEKGLPKILIVDDNSSNRLFMNHCLSSYVRIIEAEDGITGVTFASKEHFDLILMDINLGAGIDGVEAMHQIRKIPGYTRVPIITVTAYVMFGDKERFLSEGFDDYLAKPFSKNILVSLVEKCLAK